MSKVRAPQSAGTHFEHVPIEKHISSTFARPLNHLTTANIGDIIPLFVEEVLPGDHFNVHASVFCRFNTLLDPIFTNVKLHVKYFFVPMRLIWDNTERFFGQQDNPTDINAYTIPEVRSPPNGGFVTGSLADYFGIQTDVPNFFVSALQFRGYNFIYNDRFRDQNFMDSIPCPTDDGPDDAAIYPIRRCCKLHDYFTSALPSPQKGNQNVVVPIGNKAPVSGLGLPNPNAVTSPIAAADFIETAGIVNYPGYADGVRPNVGDPFATTSSLFSAVSYTGNDTPQGAYYIKPEVYADLAASTGLDIAELRRLFQIQRFLERDARGGTRYAESILSHFGVRSPDARLQRAEILGGFSTDLQVNVVPQTAPTTGDSPQGSLSGYATFSYASKSNGFKKSFDEHGYVYALAYTRSDLSYQKGIPRQFSRQTRYDFYWPEFSHLGEQAILNKELFVVDPLTNPDQNDGVFGYQERYAEYRYRPSMVTGKMRSGTVGGALDTWHLSQNFVDLPVLSERFILEEAPIERITATPSEPDVIFDSQFMMYATRKMPLYSKPGFVDHF